MVKKTLYYSTDKLYELKKKSFSSRDILILCIVSTIILLIATYASFTQSVKINSKKADIVYTETGKVDYKVYLKDNDYYESSYLGSGMQYVASLIKTINVKFNYEMHASSDIVFNSNYKILAELQITERDAPSKVLYKKSEDLVTPTNISVTDNNIVINEEIDIDYDKYNNIVNTYKRDLGLVVSSELKVSLINETKKTYEKEEVNNLNKLQLVIPLSEATLNIKMDANEINNTNTLGNTKNLFKIKNTFLFIICVLLLLVTIFNISLDVYIYLKFLKKDIYRTKVKKLLSDYDRLIVKGKVDIDENKYNNKIITEDFKELVDAAQNLNQPILFYETIPNEKCFFIVIKDDTLYKYRLTKAYLQNNSDEDKKDAL